MQSIGYGIICTVTNQRIPDLPLGALRQNIRKWALMLFREICELNVDDGLFFDVDTVKAEQISENADYGGISVKFVGNLENVRIPIQIDLGFCDVITPTPVETEIPCFLDLPATMLITYPKESIIAEKLEAMFSLGIANDRMKDSHDTQTLSHKLPFEGVILSEAIGKMFAARITMLPSGIPLAFTADISDDQDRNKQWTAFCRINRGYIAEVSLRFVCEEIAEFLMRVLSPDYS
jgi:hypothetical protein